MRTTLAGLLVILIAVPAAPQQQAPVSIADTAGMARLLREARVPGVSIAIIKDFKVAAAIVHGVADVETGAPVTAETLFQAASISKPVAAMASLKAVQDGLFSLDQDINTILTSWRLPGDGFTDTTPVTPRGLLSHTAGLGDSYGFPPYMSAAVLPRVVDALDGIRPALERPVRLERAPGTAYKYSGGGSLIQQLALTDAAGKPLEQIAREWIFGPLGMTHSTFEPALPSDLERLAARAHDQFGLRRSLPWYVYSAQAAAGLWTTPTDLARFAIDIQRSLRGDSGRVLTPAMAREMMFPAGVGPWGLGLHLNRTGEGWYFMHTGSSWGYHSELLVHISKGYGAVIMTNGDAAVPLLRQLRQIIHREYGWDTLDPPIAPGYGPR
jgi:CubicO group peptidase (beta-lactamase class C family)